MIITEKIVPGAVRIVLSAEDVQALVVVLERCDDVLDDEPDKPPTPQTWRLRTLYAALDACHAALEAKPDDDLG